jgi:hypothetical protein
MSDAENVPDLVKSLTLVSNNILVKMIPIMQKLIDADNDLTEEVAYSANIEDHAKVNAWLQERTISLIDNSERVKKEAGKFLEFYKKDSDESLYKNVKHYPFLAEVWFGDNYDGVEGIEAFQTLLKDLKSELEMVDEDKLIENATSYFSKLKE